VSDVSGAALNVGPAGPAHVAVIGGGPAGLMAAEVISAAQSLPDGRAIAVTIYDRMPTVGRKLMIAGRGGLNLTHSEDLARFLARYGAREVALRAAIEAFSPSAARTWAEGLGQETFVGTSGRVFPTAMKASPLLRAWLRRLAAQGVRLATRHRWLGWGEAGLLAFDAPSGRVQVAADAVVLALGGASWPRLGSDGTWVEPLRRAGVSVAPLKPANCAFLAPWSEVLRARFAGEPLKRIAITHGGITVRGETVLTAAGIEGGAIYALSATLRDAIARDGCATIAIDLRPDLAVADLAEALGAPRRKQSLSSFLRKAAQLSPAAIGLLQEAAHTSGQPLGALDGDALAARIKAVPVTLTGTAPIAKAISTAGGVAFEELDGRFMLTRRPGTFVAGEMLDWEAPTGGYLLQACLATGAVVGRGVLEWLAQSRAGLPPPAP